ncbi:kinase-like domain-containing protein [Kockovaella imperatae]|uniref:non-specific serine/threonine protein kinase n=1 Tax=Kockovaella imperatae TaxID=4999 RepID=A0A1Y1UR95_9TREE|nr:kinase-like domain-containing protein [Kockovaella imperatae]ORX39956.1 kinase-like domain-containing protein [Kockovaella imperatae]
MYQGSAYASPPSGYTSPPPPNDSYRRAPISVASRQPYTFSPPPPSSNGYSSPRYSSQAAQSPQMQAQRQMAFPTPPGAGGSYPQQPAQLPPARHKGTLAPGQIVVIGDSSVRIEKYLSEGGYAHVYLTSSDKPIYPPVKSGSRDSRDSRGYTQQCLKRIAFQDEKYWIEVKKEIEVMKALPVNPYLVQYLGSAHKDLPDGTHEVFILMEFAAGGGIIDLLNRRLRDRLKEIEILNIFTDVCEAVAAMHALPKPLVHRDLKIENVLAAPSSSPPLPQRPSPFTFKLCDFGSTTYPASRPPTSKIEADALAMDLDAHTTLQYRSPEMVEPMLGYAVGLPSDVWALGVLLYKLCYYTTPFEDHGTLAIVNAKYTFPQYPVYSPKVQHLIASMLVEQPSRRPTVFEVLRVAHDMSGTRPYPIPSRSIPGAPQTRSPVQSESNSANLLDFTSPSETASQPTQPSLMPNIQPQRRGRPTKEPSQNQIQTIGALPRPPAMSPYPSTSFTPPLPQAQSPAVVAEPQYSVNKVQVTGERDALNPSARRVDAFGMPASLQPSKAGSGFSDSFGSLKSPLQDSKSGSSRLGFGDSFSSSKTSPTASFPVTFGAPRTASPPRVSNLSRSPNSAAPTDGGEANFDTRFPSIESLEAAEPLIGGDSTRQSSNLISPLEETPRPSSFRKPSMIGNMTGGDLSPAQRNHRQEGAAPQPRSTHVTGTAFAYEDLLSPSVDAQNTWGMGESNVEGYASLSGDDTQRPGKEPVSSTSSPEDLMTGDGDTMGGSSMRPLLISRASSTFHMRDNAPEGQTSRNVAAMNSTSVQANVGSMDDVNRVNSSDDEAGPESASAQRWQRFPSSERVPLRQPSQVEESDQRPAALERRGSSPSKTQQQSSPIEPHAGAFSPSSRPHPNPMMPGQRETNTGGPTPSTSDSRPAQSREGSITSMVSRFETMNGKPPGLSPVKQKPTISTSASQAPRPQVAAKPQALRQYSGSFSKSSGSPMTAEALSPTSPKVKPPKPMTKPDLGRSASVTATQKSPPAAIKEKPATKPKPVVATKPTSQKVDESQAQQNLVPVEEKTPESSSQGQGPIQEPSQNGRGSPEKRQSVNSLIAKWNQQKI